MSKQRDAVKERFWRGVMRKWSASGLGARRFCRQAGIAEHQLHSWRRTLAARDQEAGSSSRNSQPHGQSSPTARPADQLGRQRLNSAARHRTATGASSAARDNSARESAFLRVLLPAVAAPLEIVHPQGCVIRVPHDGDPTALARVLAVLDAAHRMRGGG